MSSIRSNVDHYLPKLLLRNFCIEGSDQVFVFDKHDDRVFKTAIRNIAAERGFYDFEIDGRAVSVDPILTDLEGRGAGVVQKIVERQELSELSGSEKAWLLIFVTFQFLRGPQFREMIREMNATISQKIIRMGFDPNNVEGFKSLDENGVKEFACSMFMDAIEYFDHFRRKDLTLFRTNAKDPFYVGDNPIALHNENDFSPYGNLGLAVPGIEIYFPLSSTLTLGLWCPSVTEKLRTSHAETRKHLEHFKALRVLGQNIDRARLEEGLTQSRKAFAATESTVSAIEAGSPIECDAENVLHLNSHQVSFAHRFVMSSHDDFSLATKMIGDNEQFRRGLLPRLK